MRVGNGTRDVLTRWIVRSVPVTCSDWLRSALIRGEFMRVNRAVVVIVLVAGLMPGLAQDQPLGAAGSVRATAELASRGEIEAAIQELDILESNIGANWTGMEELKTAAALEVLRIVAELPARKYPKLREAIRKGAMFPERRKSDTSHRDVVQMLRNWRNATAQNTLRNHLAEPDRDVVALVLSVRANAPTPELRVSAHIALTRARLEQTHGPLEAVLGGVHRERMAKFITFIRQAGSSRMRPWAARVLAMEREFPQDLKRARALLAGYLREFPEIEKRSASSLFLSNCDDHLNTAAATLVGERGSRLWYWSGVVRSASPPRLLLPLDLAVQQAEYAVQVEPVAPSARSTLAFALAYRSVVCAALRGVDISSRSQQLYDVILRSDVGRIRCFPATVVDDAVVRALEEKRYRVTAALIQNLSLCPDLFYVTKKSGVARAAISEVGHVRGRAMRCLRLFAERGTEQAQRAGEFLGMLSESERSDVRELARAELVALND